MSPWLVVNHSEVGFIVLWHECVETADPTKERMIVVGDFPTFEAALKFVGQNCGLLAFMRPDYNSPLTCTVGPGAPQFAVTRSRDSGEAQIFTRATLPGVLGSYGNCDCDTPVHWAYTRTEATALRDRLA